MRNTGHKILRAHVEIMTGVVLVQWKNDSSDMGAQIHHGNNFIKRLTSYFLKRPGQSIL